MDKFILGRTGLSVSRSGFGAIPIQRISFDEAKAILRRAYDGGINFYDTARGYSDSEEKIAYALSDVRHEIIIATKSHASNAEALMKDLETSLSKLKTDYIDIYQLHNPDYLPEYGSDIYQALLNAKKQGKIRFISISNHRLDLAARMVCSGLFDTMQFPISSLSDGKDFELVKLCRELDVGFIAMKAMSGGLITDPAPTFSMLRSYGNIVPIWGIQHMWELEQFLALEANPPELNDEMMKTIERDRAELSGNFCRGCGYCMPGCPAKIPISQAARISLLLRRSVASKLITPDFQAMMKRVDDCQNCGQCSKHCPYNLDTPELLRREYKYYRNYLTEHAS
ncbi:MAG: aldo/keto reductase [Treponema sp.]|nr:aldo/keto reductase [Treponema sp.]